MFIRDSDKPYFRRYYKALEGGHVKSAGLTVDGFPYFTVVFANGEEYTLEVSQDPEGNGPGFLFGLPTPRET